MRDDDDVDGKMSLIDLARLYLMILQISESGEHSLVQVEQVLSNLCLALLGRIFELHARQFVQNAAHVITNRRPRDLVLRLSCRLDRSSRRIVEADQIVQHEHGLVERTKAIVCSVAVLLQKVVLD